MLHAIWECAMKAKLQSYAGALTAAEITAGIAAAQSNALRLIEDAKLLFDAGRHPSACALAILAMEERGKTQILKRMALATDPADMKAAWREYRSHRAKNAGWIIPQLVAAGARTMKGMASAIDSEAEHAALLDGVKQVSLYTDCLGDRHWSIPEKVVSESLARSMIASAEAMWGAEAISLREVELWGQIVGPHYSKPTMGQAVLQWQAAMVAEGLSDTPVEALAAFIKGAPQGIIMRGEPVEAQGSD